jgi:hypothetical protein
MSIKFINLTAHEVTVANPYLNLSFKPSGKVARVDMQFEKKSLDVEVAEGMIVSVPCQTMPKARITNLPDPQKDVYYIVSNYVAQTVKRPDLVAPLTDNSADRDESGNITSVRCFQIYSADQELETGEKLLQVSGGR